MDILEKSLPIKNEVEAQEVALSRAELEKSPFFGHNGSSLKEALRAEGASGIIAEFKRRSPSKGWLHKTAQAEDIARGYAQAGASGMSVLTDATFFGAQADDFAQVRQTVGLPLLRKDFMVSEYQVLEAKAMGADVILLIAACLPPHQIREMARLARQLGLEVLLEVHQAQELEESLNEYIDLVGVNNRNLKTFEVRLETSLVLADKIPDGIVKISESGLSQPESVQRLRAAGYQGFLMGEFFMKQNHPGEACRDFIAQAQSLPATSS
ncbi:MAG: indole-3-glycerol phosphate synthase TrpC [Microscillaceae bacterium]|nr:indole-3-glycerol phosphate synthase TrpC [Microscillaceae bacterium]